MDNNLPLNTKDGVPSSQFIKHTKKVVLIALFGAMLSAIKFMLMAIPNVELVTFLIVLFTVSSGPKITLPGTLVFCTIELFLFGLTPFAITYYIHWPFVVLATAVAKNYLKTEFGYAILVFFITALFGVQSSLASIIISGGLKSDSFWSKFTIMYLNGTLFYVTHIVSNTLIMLFLFTPSKRVLDKLYLTYSKN